MSNPSEAEAPAGPEVPGAPGGAPKGPQGLTAEDLSAAYNLGLRNNNELTQQLLLDQGWTREKIVAVFNRMNEARAGVIRKKGDNVCCVVRPATVIPALKQLDAFDYKIYCAVELAGNTDCWGVVLHKWRVQRAACRGEVGGGAFTDEDILQLVATLECEDKVARIQTGTEWNHSENLRLLEGVPCVGCALVNECSADGRVNPRDCTYLSHWLGLDVEVEPQDEEEEPEPEA